MAVTTAAVLTAAAVGSQLAGAGMSFTQARKQKQRQREAEATADKYMAEARKSLEKNYMESLAIQKEPYELEREAALAAGAQATEALRESDRGAGRVGAIYGQQQQAQRQIAAAMGQELFNLDYLTAQEESRLRDIGTQLDLGEVSGAQLAAAEAEERRQQQLQAGVKAIGGAAMTGLESMALYRDKGGALAPRVDTSTLRIKGQTPQERLAKAQSDAFMGFDPTQSFMTSIEDLNQQSRIAPSSLESIFGTATSRPLPSSVIEANR